MIQLNSNLAENSVSENSGDTLEKYVEAIRHFRGFVNKERFNEDVTFLREFVREINETADERQKAAWTGGVHGLLRSFHIISVKF